MRKSLWVPALLLSVGLSVCMVAPAPNLTVLPLTLAAPEFSSWLALVQLVLLASALVFERRVAIVFLLGLAATAWPLAEVQGVNRRMAAQLPVGYAAVSLTDCFRPMPAVAVTPVSLPMGILYYAGAGNGPRPGIIDIYGGAWQRGAPADDERFDSYMASKGYAVFAIDYRHAPAFRFPAQLEDVRAAVAFLRDHAASYRLDADRLVLCGRSSRAQLALLAAYDDPPAGVSAAIGFYSPSNLTAGYYDVPSPDPIHVQPVLTSYLGGTPEGMPDRYRAASPLSYADRKVPPTLLIQGGRDHIVLPKFSRELQAKLTASGNRAVLLELPWAEHAFDAAPGLGYRLSLRAVEAFLADVLPSP